MKIKLTSPEAKYLNQTALLDNLSHQMEGKEPIYLSIEPDQVNELRDKLGEFLQDSGFDEEYELTSDGKIISSLIDKLLLA